MAGDLTYRVIYESLAPRRHNLPEGALSQTLEILEGHRRICVAHRYANARGRSLPGHELLDPKYLEIDGQSYSLAGKDEVPLDPII